MCLPHVINICSGKIISKVTNKELIDNSKDLDDSCLYGETPSHQTYKEAVKCDLIALGCSIVQVIHASGQHWDAFQDIISSRNSKNWWRVKVDDKEISVQLKPLQLLHDVHTQWDSVFLILRCL